MMKHLTRLAVVLITILVLAGCSTIGESNPHTINLTPTPNPLTHPVATAANAIAPFHLPLLILCAAAWFAWAVEIGLSYTAISFLSFLAPAFRWVAILSTVGLLVFPYIPIGFVAIGLALAGLYVYEMLKDKGNAKQAFLDEESLLGFNRNLSSQARVAPAVVLPK